jgi:serine/threonine-protein kinase
MYPQVFGKYILERELGRGGMARILEATLRGAGGFEKKLVVKQIRDELLIDGEFIRRFVEEAKTTVALSHPNIVPVYELGVEQGTYFLAMELVEGLSLDQLLRHEAQGGERNQLFPEEGAYIGVEVCRALDYAHRRMKVVHRDITPRNVMIDEEGQVKLIDFGIAAPAEKAGQLVFGSPGHMPPEQVEGRELGPPTDIFAVAVLLMEAWTGRAPFRRKTMEECDEAMHAKHPRPGDADPRLLPLNDAILKAMKLDPKERQQDADELGRSLRHFLSGIDTQDVARTLGARVYHARKKMEEDAPAPESKSTVRAPSQAEVQTRTFAARGELDKWSRPAAEEIVSDAHIPADAPSTRRIPASTPPSMAAAAAADPDAPPPPTSAPHSKKMPAAREFAVRGRPQEPPVETIATRPIVTPVRPLTSSSLAPSAPASKRRGVLQIALVFAAGSAAAWFFLVRPKTVATDMPSAPDAAVAMTSSAPSAAAPPSATPSVAVTDKGPEPKPPGSAPIAPPPSSALATSSAGTTAPSSVRAYLALFGTPGTRVAVDGQPSRPCPARMSVDSGSHDIRFMFEQTGESRGERLVLKPGEHVSLRADFTQAQPTISIQR